MNTVYCVMVSNVKFDFDCDDYTATIQDKEKASESVERKCFDIPMNLEADAMVDIIADRLSDVSGWLVTDFEYGIIATHEEGYHD